MIRDKGVKFLVESGVMIALASVLSFVKVYSAPYGGSVTAGSMIPIILIALRWGTIPGLLTGVAYGLVQSVIEVHFAHPVQYILDYPLAFGLLGMAGLYKDVFKGKFKSLKLDYFTMGLSVFIAIFGRFIAHLLAGVVFWKSFAGDMNPWVYSTLYNAGYLVPELIISIIIMSLLWRSLKKISI